MDRKTANRYANEIRSELSEKFVRYAKINFQNLAGPNPELSERFQSAACREFDEMNVSIDKLKKRLDRLNLMSPAGRADAIEIIACMRAYAIRMDNMIETLKKEVQNDQHSRLSSHPAG